MSEPCGCELVRTEQCGEFQLVIRYCALHEAAPANAELAGAGLKLAKAVRGSTTITPRIMVLARKVVETAEPKGNK